MLRVVGGVSEERLSDRVRKATAGYTSTATSATIECDPWQFGRLDCGPNDWNWVGEANVLINGKEEKCIWAHPLASHTLKVVFEDIQLPESFKGKYALSDEAAASSNRTPLTFRVFVNEEEKVKRVVTPRRGWSNFTLKLEATTAPVDLSFEIETEFDGARHFCFDAILSEATPAE